LNSKRHCFVEMGNLSEQKTTTDAWGTTRSGGSEETKRRESHAQKGKRSVSEEKKKGRSAKGQQGNDAKGG